MNKANLTLFIALLALFGLVLHALTPTPPSHVLAPAGTPLGRFQRMLPGNTPTA